MITNVPRTAIVEDGKRREVYENQTEVPIAEPRLKAKVQMQTLQRLMMRKLSKLARAFFASN